MLWLEDFLPEVLPHARIMTFGYDSSLLLSHSKGRIEHFAIDLLNRLWMLRQSPEVCLLFSSPCQPPRDTTDSLLKSRNRPLVFIAHSLGGIVVKKVCNSSVRRFSPVVS